MSPWLAAFLDRQIGFLDIARVVANWTGIPVGRMVKDEIASVLMIGDALKGWAAVFIAQQMGFSDTVIGLVALAVYGPLTLRAVRGRP